MSQWERGTSPFPDGKVHKISDIAYIGELKLVRHAQVHLDKTPRSKW